MRKLLAAVDGRDALVAFGLTLLAAGLAYQWSIGIAGVVVGAVLVVLALVPLLRRG